MCYLIDVLKKHSFPQALLSENYLLLGTDNVSGQITKKWLLFIAQPLFPAALSNATYCNWNRRLQGSRCPYLPGTSKWSRHETINCQKQTSTF